jgi:L-ascorbate metabolism protein UlaG (beta-lactamase superfamily)
MRKTFYVTFFYHSCVAFEYNNYYFLFDYFPGNVPIKHHFPKDKYSYILSSHVHHDHFHNEIFKKDFIMSKKIYYILSDDILDENPKLFKNKSILWVKPYKTYQINDIIIKTFGSTDKGVSFLININEINIFHCGDLNWWHWKHFTKEEQELERINYQNEIKKISTHTIDLAFVPVDPRLGDASYWAADYFIDKVKPKYLVPIHLHGNFKYMQDYAQTSKSTTSKILTFSRTGEIKTIEF